MMDGYVIVPGDEWAMGVGVEALIVGGGAEVVCEAASGARADRAQLRKVLATLEGGGVHVVTRLDRLGRSTRQLLNTLAAIAERKAGFRSVGGTRADTTTPHGRLILTVLGGLAEFERELIRARTSEGRACAVKLGRQPKLTLHQIKEVLRRKADGEAVRRSLAATTCGTVRFRGSA